VLTRPRIGLGLALLALASSAPAAELLVGTEGNRMRRFDVDTIGNPLQLQDVLIEAASLGETGGPGPTTPGGRDVNGMICRFPDGTGRFVAGEDTGQIAIRPGWGVFDADANQVGKLVTTYLENPNDDRQGEPYGCAFDSQGRLWTTVVGEQALGAHTGQLIVWFPPYDVFPGPPGSYPNGEISTGKFCKIDVTIGSASGVLIDAQDNVYVASPAGFQVLKFTPPFPTGPDAAGGCGRLDPTGQPLANLNRVNRSVFIQGTGITTYTGLARAKNGNLYVGQVLAGVIQEYDFGSNPLRAPVRTIVPQPPGWAADYTGTPQGLAVGADGTLYYADLDIQSNLEPGDDGKFWRVRFDAKGNPQPPEAILTGLDFPDGVALFPGDMQVDPLREWRTYAGSPERLFHAEESIITPKNVGLLRELWRVNTGSIVTSSPVVALVDLPGAGPTRVVYFQSWDGIVHAVRFSDGSSVWTFQTAFQPGAGFPNAASGHVEEVSGRDLLLISGGEWLYALDAATGAEVWRFTAGTGCVDGLGHPPGLCGFGGERNQVESSAIVADGKVFVGLDINDVALGKGGFMAVNVETGLLEWFFDLESGKTCHTQPGDAITHFDGYHSEAELGLPPGFRSRPGCDFPFSRNGCGNVWSSAALDVERGAIFTASSNCDTDENPATGEPPPPMPPFDEAIFSLDLDGNVRWRWRLREVDNDDFAYGAVPNLFQIDRGDGPIDVVGIGNKDGSYVVIDRDGVNEESGVAWNDSDPSALPYWRTRVVNGGAFGGVVATASVDTDARRVFFTTAPGDTQLEVLNPQLPTVHALNLDTGAIAWDTGIVPGDDASFGPTSSVPGLMLAGSTFSATLRGFDTVNDSGAQPLARRLFTSPLGIGDAIASGAVVVDGNIIVGTGVGFRGPDPGDLADVVSRIPSPVVALCIPGQPGCSIPRWRLSDLDDDRDVDDADLGLFRGALGSSAGQPAFRDLADLDRDGAVTLADYQLWLAGRREYQLASACGLLGVEPLLALGLVRLVRRRRARPR
jgi:outer membrane protein assembly factor BamB